MANRGLSVLKFARLSRSDFRRVAAGRSFSTGFNVTENIVNIPLSKSVPWIPAPSYASASEGEDETQVTQLDSGLRVATQSKFGQFCTVGVLVDSGSRYEVAYPSGVTHFLEKLAFSSTTNYKNRDVIMQVLEKHGAICDCQGSRDTLIYAVSAETTGVGKMVDILSEALLRPCISEQEVEESRQAIAFELQSLDMRPDPEPLLMEQIHAAAYSDNTLGLPKICPEDNIANIDKGILYTYMKHHHSLDRVVLAGVGVNHDTLLNLADQHFSSKTPIWEEHKDLIDRRRGQDKSVSQYTGGILQVEKDLSNVSLGPTPMPELAHVVIGLESSSHRDPDFISYCVLNMLMGGGGSFSAGGPGKGMYTRLYLNVLNRHHWIYNATAFNHAYGDSGVFCIHASAHPAQLKELVDVITREIVGLQNGVAPAELARAKTQLQSMLMMNLESRPVVFEDVGRQVLANNKRLSPKYYFDKIGEVQNEDIIRVAKRMLSSRPAVSAYGSLANLPAYGDIQVALTSKDGRLPRKFKLFG